jgi:cell division cycle 14
MLHSLVRITAPSPITALTSPLCTTPIGINPPFVTYRDAGFCVNIFPITVLDCARAMHRARVLGHFAYKTFSLQTYQHLQKLQNGDISWIIPGKFIAFSGPLTK